MKLKLSNENLYFILGGDFIKCNYENGSARAWEPNAENKTPHDLMKMIVKIKSLCVNIENPAVVNALSKHIQEWETIQKNYKGPAIAQNARNIDKLVVPGVKDVCKIFNDIDCDLNSKTTFGLVLGVENHKIKDLLNSFFTSSNGVLQQKDLCKAVYDNSLKKYEQPIHIYNAQGNTIIKFDAIFKSSLDLFKYWTTQLLLEKTVDCEQSMHNLNKVFKPFIKNATGAKNYYKAVDKILTKKKATPEQVEKYVKETIDFLRANKYFTQVDEFNALIEKSGNVVSSKVDELDFNGETKFAKNFRLSLESVARHFSVSQIKASAISDKLLDQFRVFLTGEPEFEDIVLDTKGSKASMTNYLSVEYTESQKEKIEPILDEYYKVFLSTIPLLKIEDTNSVTKVCDILSAAVVKNRIDKQIASVEIEDNTFLPRNTFKL